MELLAYEVLIQWSDEDHAFVARVPGLPGCMAHGSTRTRATAQENIEQAIALWLVHRFRSAMTYSHAAWSSEGVADAGVAGHEAGEVLSGELPLEGRGDLLVVLLKAEDTVGDFVLGK